MLYLLGKQMQKSSKGKQYVKPHSCLSKGGRVIEGNEKGKTESLQWPLNMAEGQLRERGSREIQEVNWLSDSTGN